MPLYEYKCHNCGKTFEVIQKFTDEPLKTHSECNDGPVEKLLSPPALQFKGSGWYVTDYAKANGSDKKKSETTEAKPESSPTKESKPASTTSSTETKPPATT